MTLDLKQNNSQIYNKKLLKEKEMIKYYTSSTYRKHYSDLQKLNMLSQSLELDPLHISLYLLKNTKDKNTNASKSSSKSATRSNTIEDPQKCFNELTHDLQVYKNLTISPIKAFKSLLLIHCTFLLVKISPNQENTDKLNSYFKWILQETVNMIHRQSQKQNKKRTSSIDKKEGFFSKSAKSLRALSPSLPSTPKINQRSKSTGKNAKEEILSKEICLLSSIVKPYILYLQKILAIYSHYQSLMRSIPSTLQSSQESVWTVLNLFKLMAPIVSTFVYIGRYFYKDYSQVVYLLIEFFSKQVNRLYPLLRAQVQKRTSKIQHEWFKLLANHSEYEILHNSDIQIQGVDDAMLLVDEILKLNDNLYYIYYGKHFYTIVERLKLPIPKWLNINSKDCQFLVHYVGSKDKSKKRRFSKDKKAPPVSSMNLPSQLTSQKSPKINQAVNEMKVVLPKPKKALKLNDTIRQDTITFRLKQSDEIPTNRNRMLGSLSFSKQSSTQESERIQDLSNNN